MMKKPFFLISLAVLLMFAGGCNNKVTLNEVVKIEVDTTVSIADGGSGFKVYALIPSVAPVTNRGVLFSASSGTFANKKDTIYATADTIGVDSNTGYWRVGVAYTSGLQPGKVNLSVSTITTPVYTANQTITLDTSFPAKITLQQSSFNVIDSFQNGVTITGILTNAKGKKVSMGLPVQITDQYKANGAQVGGYFINQQLLTDTAGHITAIYNPGVVAPNQYINLIVWWQGANGSPMVADTALIYVSP